MNTWTRDAARLKIDSFDTLSPDRQDALIAYCNEHFPPSVYERHLACRKRAMDNVRRSKEVLLGVTQKFPPLLTRERVSGGIEDMRGVAIVLTAGGEGERLKKSLMERGAGEERLKDFTKATYPLPGFYEDYGALQTNLRLIARLSDQLGFDIPVIVTTGPAGSITARVVPQLISSHNHFGLKRIKVLEQDARLHLTMDDTMAYTLVDGSAVPITHPDETGGPLMKLKSGSVGGGVNLLTWLEQIGCSKMLVLQATGLYDPTLLPAMASALNQYDCIGAGIVRTAFDALDPFGTYVTVVNKTAEKVIIIEQDIRNDTTRALRDETGRFFLPYNTGLYAFKNELLTENDLPDYATPPKEILPNLSRSPKIGYAATDIFSLAGSAAVLSIPANSFAVIKNADDLALLTELGKRYGLDKICHEDA